MKPILRWTKADGTVRTLSLEQFKDEAWATHLALVSMRNAYWYLSRQFKAGLKSRERGTNVAARLILLDLYDEILADWEWLGNELRRCQAEAEEQERNGIVLCMN